MGNDISDTKHRCCLASDTSYNRFLSRQWYSSFAFHLRSQGLKPYYSLSFQSLLSVCDPPNFWEWLPPSVYRLPGVRRGVRDSCSLAFIVLITEVLYLFQKNSKPVESILSKIRTNEPEKGHSSSKILLEIILNTANYFFKLPEKLLEVGDSKL